jgi:hypothetical protein
LFYAVCGSIILFENVRIPALPTDQSSIPSFEEVVTNDWLNAVFENGVWDPTHGSPVDRWIDDLRDGTLGKSAQLPKHLIGAEDSELLTDPEFKAIMVGWLRLRFNHVMSELEATDITQVGRRMSVDNDWVSALENGKSSVGIYWGDLPLDSGEFWYDEDQPVDIYMEASISHDDIDWVSTIRARMDYLTGDEEREIRLKENTTISISLLEIDGEPHKSESSFTVSTGSVWARTDTSNSPSP